MKTIEVDEELYRYIASQTQHIGESASNILRRLLIGDQRGSQILKDDNPLVAAAKKTANVTQEQVAASFVASEKLDGVKAMRLLLISDEFAEKSKAIDRFMLILSSLYHIEPNHFAEAAKVKGRTRVYFADNEQTLLASGKTTKPRVIPNTPFWVITNNNTNRKRQMVQQLMVQMGFQTDLIEKVCNSI